MRRPRIALLAAATLISASLVVIATTPAQAATTCTASNGDALAVCFSTAQGTAGAPAQIRVSSNIVATAKNIAVPASTFVALDLGEGSAQVTGAPGKAAISVPSGSGLTILGGPTSALIAQGGWGGAGLGGSQFERVGVVTVSSGNVVAQGGDYGAGIGGAYNADAGETVISGGLVRAVGGLHSAGIGGGGGQTQNITPGAGGKITITGGAVEAVGGESGAGLGGSSNGAFLGSAGGTITITGGEVTATGTARDTYQPAAIGGGAWGNGADLSIGSGATVTVRGNVGVGSGHVVTSTSGQFGSLDNAGTLVLSAGSATNIKTASTNSGTIRNLGTLIATARLDNSGVVRNSGSIEKSENISRHNYSVSFDTSANPGAVTPGPTTVYANSFTLGGQTLPAVPARTGYEGSWVRGSTVVQAATLLLPLVGHGPVSFRLEARYRWQQSPIVWPSPPTSPRVGTTWTPVFETGLQDNPVTVTSTTTSICTVANEVVTFRDVGTCALVGSRADDSTRVGVTENRSVVVTKQGQTVAFTSSAPADPVYPTATYQPRTTGGGSGNPVVLGAGPSTVCTLSAGLVTFTRPGECTVTADQQGSSTHDPADQTTQKITVVRIPSSVAVTASPSKPVVGQDVTLDAQVTPAIGSAAGSVQFTVNGTDFGEPVALSGGRATTTLATLDAVDYIVRVTFVPADTGTHVTSKDGAQVVLTVGKAPQVPVFTSAVPTGPIHPTTTYRPAATGGGSGNPVVLAAGPVAVCSTTDGLVTFHRAGQCTVTADQAGDSNFTAGQSTQVMTVVAIPSAVALSTSPAAPVFGQDVVVTATVTPTLGAAAGSVQFTRGGNSIGDPVPIVNGTASTTFSGLEAGTHAVTATYEPVDAGVHADGQTGALPVSVAQAVSAVKVQVTRTQVTASVNAVAPGAGTPTGTVTFEVGGQPFGTATLVGGTATLSKSVPAGAARQVSALYAGDTNFTGTAASTARHDPTLAARVISTKSKSKAGWYRTPVTIRFTCRVNGAPLAGACPAPVTLTRNGAGQRVTRTITALDGGSTSVTTAPIAIDRVKPKIRLKGVPKSISGAVPKVRCMATDQHSGIKSCKVRVKRTSSHFTWTATAVDRAGNKRVERRQAAIKAQSFTLPGVPKVGGVHQVTSGRSYTMVVVSKDRPRYLNAERAPRQPGKATTWFRRAGTVNGTPRWVLGVLIDTRMTPGTTWNLGVRAGGRTTTLQVRVSR